MTVLSELSSAALPHLGAALLVSTILLALFTRFINRAAIKAVAVTLVMLICLVPFGEYNLTHYIRVLTGDLSITGFIWFGWLVARRVIGTSAEKNNDELHWALLVSATALLLYPTALGLTYFDLYAYGLYPIVLAPALFVIFSFALWFGHKITAVMIAAGFVAFALNLFESDNLWDYLIDPFVAVYAIVMTVRHRDKIKLTAPSQRQVEVFLSLTIASFLAFAIFLARINHDAFQHDFVIEDGFVEWCTVVVLFTTMIVCAKRFLALRGRRNALFLSVTGLLVLLCLFGAGEEISWGQRIFGIETPDYLKDRNAQGELGLHNMVIEIDGEEVKLNKLIFGTGLAIALSIYLFIATPLYRTRAPVRRFFNAIAAPMPRNFHIIGYLLVVAVVELLIDSSKRGEMTEFAGSIVFALNVVYPYNPEIFEPEKPLNG